VKRNFKISALQCIAHIAVVAELKTIAFMLHLAHVGTMENGYRCGETWRKNPLPKI